MSKDVWIVIPAYNEEPIIGSVIDSLMSEGYNQIIVVDDGSEDKTARIARQKGAEVISHRENCGLGASIRTGLREARSRGVDVVVTFDADGQHNPAEIEKLLKSLDGGDLAIGERKRGQMPLNKRFGNSVLDIITHFFGGPLTDSQSGFRALNSRALDKIEIWSDRYSVSSEIAVQAGILDLEISTVPVEGIFTDYSRVSGTNIASGVRIFFELLSALIFHFG